MLVNSKKIKYFHKLTLEYNFINQKTLEYRYGNYIEMITNFDVAVGDICKIRIQKDIIEAKVLKAKRLEGEHIVDPRIISISFELDDLSFDKYDENNNYIYKVTPFDNNNKLEMVFASNVKLPEKTVVISDKAIGIIKEEIFSTNEIIENKVLHAYQCKIDEAILIYRGGIVPRYLINELLTVLKITKDTNIYSKNKIITLFNKIILVDDFTFDYEGSEVLNFLVNSARLGNKTCVKVMRDLCYRNDMAEELAYWLDKEKMIQ